MEYYQHIESLQLPNKFTGDSENFQTSTDELIKYFQKNKRIFLKIYSSCLGGFCRGKDLWEFYHFDLPACSFWIRVLIFV